MPRRGFGHRLIGIVAGLETFFAGMREVLAQYVDDVAAAQIAAAELRVLLLTPMTAP